MTRMDYHTIRIFGLPLDMTKADIIKLLGDVECKAVWVAMEGGISQRWAWVDFSTKDDLVAGTKIFRMNDIFVET